MFTALENLDNDVASHDEGFGSTELVTLVE
jgi:hypothetical protein